MSGERLFIRAEGVADLHAARGLIAALRLDPRRVTIVPADRAAAAQARRLLPRCRRGRLPRAGGRVVLFDADGPPRPSPRGAAFNHDPFKYHPAPRGEARRTLRGRMGLGRRRLVVCSLSGRAEAEAVVDAWRALRPRPALVLGMRLPDPGLAARLSGPGVVVLRRSSRAAPLSGVGACDVVVLNTMGELGRFFAAADLAVIGHDRNLFEPAAFGVPALYFPEPLRMTPRQRSMVRLFRLAWRKNRTAKRLLDAAGGARPVRADLAGQMARLLADPGRARAGARRALARYRREVMPAARRLARRLLGAAARCPGSW